MKKILGVMALIAFLIGLLDGRQGLIERAVGFFILEQEGVCYHLFVDEKGEQIGAVPSSLIKYAFFIPDDKVM